ncbi:MAG: GlmU family protein [Fimbriimonadaceae bacterium]|nr:GlmU family protein [Chitinophagales bacterium]
MSNFVLFDDNRWEQLLPLTFTKPVAALRIGIDTITEKWNYYLQTKISYLTQNYLSEKFAAYFTEDNIYVNGGVIANKNLANTIQNLKSSSVLIKDGEILAFRSSEKYFSTHSLLEHARSFSAIEFEENIISIFRPWHLFQFNDSVLKKDFERITKGKSSQKLSSTNTLIGENIFIEEGAIVEAAIINTNKGPVYIGKDVEIMEGCMLRGSIAIGKGSVIKMGAKIYGATTIGTHCKIGGEVNNAVIQNYSNKAHEGYLGNAVLGEWCNLGADTNNSNLKNTYAEVKLWDYATQKFINTGLQFCGLIMGDHSKCGINTMFNTGTVVGVSSNIFGDGYPRNFIPSYSWGGASGFTTYKLKDALLVAEIVMKRKEIILSEADKNILTTVYALSERHRKGELIFMRKKIS